MWRRLKPWILGSEKNSETQYQIGSPDEILSNDHKDKALPEDVAMVETRSRRHAPSAIESSSDISTLTKSRAKKGNQKKDKPPSEAIQTTESGILESITLDTGLITQFERADTFQAQSLPHRSRSSTRPEDEDHASERASSSHTVESNEGRQPPDDTILATEDDANGEQANPDTTTILESKDGYEVHIPSGQSRKRDRKRKRTRISENHVTETQSAPVSNHKRFTSEEPTSQPQILESQVEDLDENIQPETVDDQSEDDAPEEVTAIAAAREAKASATKTAQSIKIQKEANRAKRQKRDHELKTQAQTSKKRKVEPDLPKVLDKTTHPGSPPAKIPGVYMDDLPDELPAEILASEPNPSVDLLNTRSERRKRPNKRKRLDQDLKPPKDVRIGNTSVRVLSSANPSLPPPAQRRANNVKEAWLRARMQESKTKVAGYKIKGAGARSFLC